MDSYGPGGCDTDSLRIEQIDKNGSSVHPQNPYLCV